MFFLFLLLILLSLLYIYIYVCHYRCLETAFCQTVSQVEIELNYTQPWLLV